MNAAALPAPLGPGDRDLLLRLLRLPTAGPLEPGAPPPRLAEAQVAYRRHAARIGLRAVRHAPAGPADLDGGPVPAAVRAAVSRPGFLTCQPSLVLRLGPDGLPAARTVMFNVHLDTVAGRQPVAFDGDRFHGRGAIDAKGPAVALLAGIRAARAERPALGRDVGVLVQAVAGEEGGAMGVFGTRPLVRRGYTGRLNVFCEPTGGRFLTRSTAAMTARIVVGGGAAGPRPQRQRPAGLPGAASRQRARCLGAGRDRVRRGPAHRRPAQQGVRRRLAAAQSRLRVAGGRAPPGTAPAGGAE